MELERKRRERSNSLSMIVKKLKCSSVKENNPFLDDLVKKQISVVNDLEKKLEEKKQGNSDLSSQNDLLIQELEKYQKTRDNEILNIFQNENNDLTRILLEYFISEFKEIKEYHKNFISEFKKIKENHRIYEFVDNRLYLYKKIENLNGYERFPTPTTVNTDVNTDVDTDVDTGVDTDDFNNITEIHYANDIYYNKLSNAKVILYRNKDNSCYIILRISRTKYCVFYGVNERNIVLGENSFFVYEVSEIVESFTDKISRLIYLDISGLYFVPSEENSVKDIIDTYEKESKFNFKGSILKVSALDGNITFDGQPITEKNFFDNWIKVEKEIKTPITLNNGKQGWIIEVETKTILSTNRPKSIEILKNFYPPERSYKGIFAEKYYPNNNYQNWLTTDVTSIGKKWLNCFVNKYIKIAKSKSKIGCQKLVSDGTFLSILLTYTDYSNSNSFGNKRENFFNENFNKAIAETLKARPKSNCSDMRSILKMFLNNYKLFKDPEFVKYLKPSFAKVSKDYKDNKESDIWLPFEIVKNL